MDGENNKAQRTVYVDTPSSSSAGPAIALGVAAVAGGFLLYKHLHRGDDPEPGPQDPDGGGEQLDPTDPGYGLNSLTDILINSDAYDGNQLLIGTAGTNAQVLAARSDCRNQVSLLTHSDIGCKLYNQRLSCPRKPDGSPDYDTYYSLATGNGRDVLIGGYTLETFCSSGLELAWGAIHDYPTGRWLNPAWTKYRTEVLALLDKIVNRVGRDVANHTQMENRRIIIEGSRGTIPVMCSMANRWNNAAARPKFGHIPADVWGHTYMLKPNELPRGWHYFGWGQVKNNTCSDGASNCAGLTWSLMGLYFMLGLELALRDRSSDYYQLLLSEGKRIYEETHGPCITYDNRDDLCAVDKDRWLSVCDSINSPMTPDELRTLLADIQPAD